MLKGIQSFFFIIQQFTIVCKFVYEIFPVGEKKTWNMANGWQDFWKTAELCSAEPRRNSGVFIVVIQENWWKNGKHVPRRKKWQERSSDELTGKYLEPEDVEQTSNFNPRVRVVQFCFKNDIRRVRAVNHCERLPATRRQDTFRCFNIHTRLCVPMTRQRNQTVSRRQWYRPVVYGGTWHLTCHQSPHHSLLHDDPFPARPRLFNDFFIISVTD